MFDKVRSWSWANRKTIILTFEVFWILIFLLERVSNINPAKIPQFIYVNF